jgi:hypothetical protein
VGSYYYFAATLTTLELGAPAPMSSEDFLGYCRRHLDPSDLGIVEGAVLLSPPEGPPAAASGSMLLRRYYSWERTLRNELARLRARGLDRAAEPWIRPAERDGGAVRAAAAAFQCPTPLVAELLLEQERWTVIRTDAALHVFGLDRIIAYRLELQILERLARLREEQGEPRYREAYAAILGAADISSGVQR